MINQSHLQEVREYLDVGRWVPLFVLCLVSFIGKMRRGYLGKHVRLHDGVMLLWICAAFASALYSVDPDITMMRTSTLLLMYVSLFWGIGWNLGSESEDTIVGALMNAGIVAFVLGPALAPLGKTMWQSSGRYMGLFENPNSLGLLGALLLPLFVERVLRRGNRKDWIFLSIIVVSVVLSGSRGGMLAGLSGATYVLHKSRERFFWAGVILTVTLALWMSYGPRLDDLWDNPIVRAESLESGSGRLEAWPVALDIISEKPFFGHGFGTEDSMFEMYGYGSSSFQEHQGAYFHNSYLGMAAQMGVIGAIAFFGPLLAFTMRQIAGSWRDRIVMPKHGLQGVVVAGLVACLFESWIYSMGNCQAFPFWFSVMMLMEGKNNALTSLENCSDVPQDSANS